MKSLFAVFLFAASLLAISSAIKCPYGQLHNNVVPKESKDCSFYCVQYRCAGQKHDRFGCKEDAFEECPVFEENDKLPTGTGHLGYCEKNAEDKVVSFFFPSCYGESNYWECIKKREFEISYYRFWMDCDKGEEKYIHLHDSSSGVLCSRVNAVTGQKNALPYVCNACAIYGCKKENAKKEMEWARGGGCIGNFFEECKEYEDDIKAVKAEKNFYRTSYCKENIYYWSGCGGEADWWSCMAAGTKWNKTFEEEAAKCNVQPSAALMGTLPPPVHADDENAQDNGNDGSKSDGKNDALKTALGSLWFFVASNLVLLLI